LYECEKHSREEEWEEAHVGDRISGILMQLISCLQCRRLPNFFLQNVNLFKGKSPQLMDNAAKITWKLFRELLTNPEALQTL